MIVPITGNVTYTITLDPTVWIFDDRKILLDEAFTENKVDHDQEDELEKASRRFNQEVYQQKINPPVNKSISRMEGKKILENSYVMPINEFLNHAEINENATDATLVITNGDEQQVSLQALKECYLLFAMDGKPLKDDGPVHFLYRDGSNRDNPIKGVKKIIIN
ncbi:hypothetical protein [Lentibacillus cibarius]|uniref:Peptidyl-prolyl cis-trans isomerase n=1 Tax=Lentibacillus cibarius TaxID=2583219 RepID=A0A5S3QNQ5_9BACI|nr:hypothetical protein [Lentibacillus cibarius]TMN23455.1 hypothetical protein FFL34_16150 [Lentibacillus cibarius]